MSNNKQTQTIDLQPLFDTLKDCGFTDLLAKNKSASQVYNFFFRRLFNHDTISVDFRMLHTSSDIIVEVEIAGKIGKIDEVRINDPSMLTKKDILRIVERQVDNLFRSTNDAVSREINLIKSK